jgi:hypothetical protein
MRTRGGGDSSFATLARASFGYSSIGTLLGSLPVTGTAQAASPDGRSLYVLGGGALHTIDLTQF